MRGEPESPSLPVTDRSRGVLREIALFLPHFAVLIKRLLGDPRVPRRSKLILGGTLLYLVSPIDVVPDFVPGLGQVDDLVVVLLSLHGLLNLVDEEVVLEHWDGNEDVMRLIRRGLASVSQILPGDLKRHL